MFRYLKEAFFVRPRVPLLGGVPINVLASIIFGIFGFVHPGFWLLGAGLIGGFVLMLVNSPRFRNIVNSKDIAIQDWQAAAVEKTLISQLPSAARVRLERLNERCGKVIEGYARAEAEPFVMDSGREALKKLQWVYLKLLVAQANLQSRDPEAMSTEINREIAAAEKDLKSVRLSPSVRQSREATLEILNKRLVNMQRRAQSLEEINSDLTRIDAQIDLALEEAALKSQPAVLSANIDLASQLLDSGVFGESERMVMDLDERIGTKS